MESDAVVFRIIFNEIRDQPFPDQRVRSKLADAIVSYWQDFDSKIPRNSPAVAEWLQKELKTSDVTRLNRATATLEYALFQLGSSADGCLSDAKLLEQSIGKQPLYEMYAWLRITDCYSNPHAVEIYLKQARLSAGLYDGPITMVHATALHSLISGKIANALVQH
ncbi:hypothetical protein [Rhizobium leguminosarum]|uniref:hypothetical protein n=1 Tax=Rhizobium leguminosarum TaxID=384 RepID=UPI003F9D9DA4